VNVAVGLISSVEVIVEEGVTVLVEAGSHVVVIGHVVSVTTTVSVVDGISVCVGVPSSRVQALSDMASNKIHTYRRIHTSLSYLSFSIIMN